MVDRGRDAAVFAAMKGVTFSGRMIHIVKASLPDKMTTTPSGTPCAFCTLPAERIVFSNSHGIVVRDGYPISTGHTLVIPRRHTESFFDLGGQERNALIALVDEAKRRLDRELAPDAYNIGINDGAAAGQTIPHLHIHLIPRYAGDLPDPRGGVRWIIPDRANYWSVR